MYASMLSLTLPFSGRTLLAIVLGYSALCYLVARLLGQQRKIGFGRSYLLSILLTPVVGLICCLTSKKEPANDEKSDVRYTTIGCFIILFVVIIAYLLQIKQ